MSTATGNSSSNNNNNNNNNSNNGWQAPSPPPSSHGPIKKKKKSGRTAAEKRRLEAAAEEEYNDSLPDPEDFYDQTGRPTVNFTAAESAINDALLGGPAPSFQPPPSPPTVSPVSTPSATAEPSQTTSRQIEIRIRDLEDDLRIMRRERNDANNAANNEARLRQQATNELRQVQDELRRVQDELKQAHREHDQTRARLADERDRIYFNGYDEAVRQAANHFLSAFNQRSETAADTSRKGKKRRRENSPTPPKEEATEIMDVDDDDDNDDLRTAVRESRSLHRPPSPPQTQGAGPSRAGPAQWAPGRSVTSPAPAQGIWGQSTQSPPWTGPASAGWGRAERSLPPQSIFPRSQPPPPRGHSRRPNRSVAPTDVTSIHLRTLKSVPTMIDVSTTPREHHHVANLPIPWEHSSSLSGTEVSVPHRRPVISEFAGARTYDEAWQYLYHHPNEIPEFANRLRTHSIPVDEMRLAILGAATIRRLRTERHWDRHMIHAFVFCFAAWVRNHHPTLDQLDLMRQRARIEYRAAHPPGHALPDDSFQFLQPFAQMMTERGNATNSFGIRFEAPANNNGSWNIRTGIPADEFSSIIRSLNLTNVMYSRLRAYADLTVRSRITSSPSPGTTITNPSAEYFSAPFVTADPYDYAFVRRSPHSATATAAPTAPAAAATSPNSPASRTTSVPAEPSTTAPGAPTLPTPVELTTSTPATTPTSNDVEMTEAAGTNDANASKDEPMAK